MRKVWSGLLCILGMLMIILDTGTAMSGALEGIELCIRSVIPSLFPLFVLSIILTGTLNGTSIPFLRPLGKLCGVPKGAENLLVIGFLGGYPVGAQAVAQQYEDSNLSKKTARRLLGFCSNAGPAFLFGIVAPQFTARWMGWALWGIHIFSGVAVGAVLPDKTSNFVRSHDQTSVPLTTALHRAIRVMASVCGWVILFRVILTFLRRWVLWHLPEAASVVLCGILELTNGCFELDKITDEGLRFIIASGLLGFGGICVVMQTQAVTQQLGLGSYLHGKLLHSIISICFAWLIWDRPLKPFIILVLVGILCRELKKGVAIRKQLVYNRKK
jgi:sporulation integral membrane protein YlbJ